MNDKQVALLKDEKRNEVWALSKANDHIFVKTTCLGGFGGGNLNPRSHSNDDALPFLLPNGDKTMVHIVMGNDSDTGKATPKTGTLYSVAKPLEKKKLQKRAHPWSSQLMESWCLKERLANTTTVLSFLMGMLSMLAWLIT